MAEPKGGLVAMLSKEPMPLPSALKGSGVGEMDELPGEDDAAEAAGVDAMSAMMDALNASDPAGAFQALKDAIAAAGG
jgi:hypothetical protein